MPECLTEVKEKSVVVGEINNYFNKFKDVIDELNPDEIYESIQKILEANKNERFIYIFGNGGSASTASHFATDFNKGLSGKLPKKFRVVCLNDNIPTMLAMANDFHYDEIFKRQLENFLEKDDLVIGISGSGNSQNILKAIEYANQKGANTIGLVGFNGGKLKQVAQHVIHVPVLDMQQVEDAHVMIMHLMMRVLMKQEIL